jgi:hypothetical protein
MALLLLLVRLATLGLVLLQPQAQRVSQARYLCAVGDAKHTRTRAAAAGSAARAAALFCRSVPLVLLLLRLQLWQHVEHSTLLLLTLQLLSLQLLLGCLLLLGRVLLLQLTLLRLLHLLRLQWQHMLRLLH